MTDIDNYLEIKRELLQAQLRVVYRHQRKTLPRGQQLKRTSNLTIVEDILQNSDEPLHISKIIQIAQKDYNVNLERDSIVSALIKKINAGKHHDGDLTKKGHFCCWPIDGNVDGLGLRNDQDYIIDGVPGLIKGDDWYWWPTGYMGTGDLAE